MPASRPRQRHRMPRRRQRRRRRRPPRRPPRRPRPVMGRSPRSRRRHTSRVTPLVALPATATPATPQRVPVAGERVTAREVTVKAVAAARATASSPPTRFRSERAPHPRGSRRFRGRYAPHVIRELLEARAGEEYALYSRTINPQFMRVLKTIGFDRVWSRGEGQYLYDSAGNQYLDLLGGFGMFNVGRNNPRVRAALIEALELDTPGSVQLGVSLLPGLLAEELLRRTPARLERVLFTSSGTEAVEAALKLGRAATRRSRVVSADHSFHGLTLGSLSAQRNTEFSERFGPLLPGFSQVPFGDLDSLERELIGEDVAL